MMIPSLPLMLLAAPPQFDAGVPPPKAQGPSARLVGAAMFKNGFAATHRTIDVPKTGVTILAGIPSGAMGTLWFTPSEGMTLDSIVVENDPVATTQTVSAAAIESLLDMNVGSVLTLTLAEKDAPPSVLVGKLVSTVGTLAIVETGGTTRAVLKAAILRVEGKGLKWKTTQKLALTGRTMKIRTSGKPGRIEVVALERGLSWSPSYAVNLQPDGKTLTLVAKATVVNDLEPLKSLDCRFVTGFPNLPFADIMDPLVAGSVFNQAPGGFGGGFGGQGGQAMFSNQEGRRGANVGLSQDGRTEMPAQDGEALGELFFYPHKGVTVGQGGRAAYTLFSTTAPYETVYAWDLTDPAPGQARFEPRILPPNAPSTEEVWQTLRFGNNAKLPLTTGPATTFSAGEIVGQDTLKYVSPGQTAELRVTRSLDLSPDVLEEETARERGFVKRADNYPVYDRVTVRGTLTLVNRKAKAARVRIRKPFTGEWISAEGDPTVSTTAAGLRQPNPTGLAEWTKTVEPGETLKLTYTLRLLVSS